MPDEFVWEGVLSDGTPDLLDAWKLLRILREALEDEAKPWTWDTLEQLLVDACRAKGSSQGKPKRGNGMILVIQQRSSARGSSAGSCSSSWPS
ncbi:hypothetical protein ACFQ71_07030 [Streptomyces sp. NPDC056534]|uniref:hypothetical protein n=1 Tax=Streptomyces sp. NPDC056534 TaxID=3345857 RepID=UPI003677CEBD